MKHNRDDSQPEVHDVGEASAHDPGARGSAARERAAHERAAGEGQGPGESETAAAGHGIDGSARAAGERETRGDQAPHPDDVGKPDSPTDLSGGTLKYGLVRAVREFVRDQCTDLAAALTYRGVLAIAPAILALVSILGVVGNGPQIVDNLLGVVEDVASEDAVEGVEPILAQVTESQSAGLALIVGVLIALWSASGYVTAFSRAMNRIYEIEEGRPIWKLRPIMYALTVFLLILLALAAVMLVASGEVARSIGSAIGLSDTAVTVWNIAKWPVVLLVVIVAVAVLYHLTPNIKQPKFRWVSPGAALAIIVWILASVGFGFYVSNFGNYGATYGTLAGVIVFLLWMWISNLALLLGAEIDAELERSRQLQAGLPAEEEIQLPPRDTRGIDKRAKVERKEIAQGREIRERSAE